MKQPNTPAFSDLDPNLILTAIESLGYTCDGRLLALNSYENRVYRVGIESKTPIVAKFYRPNRWSTSAIHEEHAFATELFEAEIPVVAPLSLNGESLFESSGYRFALYPLQPGRAPELDQPEHLKQLGRFLARLHNIGALQTFQHRPKLSLQEFGIEAVASILASDLLPLDLLHAYESLTKDLLEQLKACLQRHADHQVVRLHGDCHLGNLLWQGEQQIFIVDLDDARNGPAIQDLWMFLSGEPNYMQARLQDVLEGYTQFRDFNPQELGLIEALRTLRILWHAAWLAQRHSEPAFQQAFPWFNSQHYWQEHILALREQLSLLLEPPSYHI